MIFNRLNSLSLNGGGSSRLRRSALLVAGLASSLLSFSRTSPAIYQDTAVLRNAPHNLFTFSSAFDNAIWTAASATLTPVAAAGPTGNAVYKIAETATNATHGFNAPAMPIVAGQSYTISIHYQAAERGFARISCINGSGQSDAWFNLTTGVVSSILLGGAVARAAITAVGGWYRCTLTFVATTTTSVAAVFRAQQIDAETGYQGVAGSGIYASAAQWEQNPDASAYTHTTAAAVYGPRFNRSTLIAQNLIRNPNAEGGTAGSLLPATGGVLPTNWTVSGALAFASGGMSVAYTTDNGMPCVDVTVNGTLDATGDLRMFFEGNTVAPAAVGQTWTGSIYAKLISGTIPTANGANIFAVRGNNSVGGNLGDLGLTAFTPGATWQRFGVTRTFVSSSVAYANLYLFNGGLPNAVVNFVLRIAFPQIEPGALVNPVALPPVGQIGPSVLYAGALAGRNLLPNPRAEGSTLGAVTDNTKLPSGWSVGGITNCSIAVAGSGTDSETGLPYTDFSITATGNGGSRISWGSPAFAATAPFAHSVYAKIVSGSMAGFAVFGARVVDQPGSTTPADMSITTLGATMQRISQGGTSAVTATSLRPEIYWSHGAAGASITIRIAAPQLEPNRLTPGQLSLPPVGQPSTSYIETGARLQIEESRTNGIRNPRAEGSSTTTGTGTGTSPAGLPTNWFYVNRVSGLTVDASPITAYGMTGYRVRLYGTTPASPGAETIEFDGRSTVAAVAGQAWSGQFFYRLAAGSIPAGMVFSHRMLTVTSGIVAVDNVPLVQTTPDATLRRATQTLASAGTTTAFVVNAAHMTSFPASTACDFTIDVFYPQLEQGAFATSTTLPPPGSPAATTRAFDAATASLGTWFKTAGTVTNLVTFSEQADQWGTNVAPNDSTVTANTSPAPDGSSNADLIIPSNTSGSHIRYMTFSGALNTTYCYSEFFKPGGYNFVRIGLANSAFGANTRYAIFDLSAGIIVSQDAGANASISAVGTFYRCSVSATSLGTGGAYVTSIEPIPTGTYAAFAGDGVSGVLAWGAMVNTGTTPGPYIPTTTTAVTKTATGPGTVIFKGVMPPVSPSSAAGCSLSDGSVSNSIWFYVPGLNATVINGRTLHGGVLGADWNLTTAAPPAGSTIKVALAWDPATNTMRGCVNGGTVFSATAPIPAGLTTFAEGSIAASRFWNGEIESTDYYPASLSNAQLQALTT